jgi:hypothetical protein
VPQNFFLKELTQGKYVVLNLLTTFLHFCIFDFLKNMERISRKSAPIICSFSPCGFEYNEYFDYLCTRFWYILGGEHQMHDTDSWDSYYYTLVRGNQR